MKYSLRSLMIFVTLASPVCIGGFAGLSLNLAILDDHHLGADVNCQQRGCGEAGHGQE